MSGEYRVRGDDEVMRPDGTRLVWCVFDSEAEETVGGCTVPAQTPDDRSLVARIAAHESWARTGDRARRTAPARAAFLKRFEAEVDPDGTLDPAERATRAEHAYKAHMARIALKSAQARRARKDELNRIAASSPEGWPEGAELVTTAQILDEPGVWQVWNQPVIGDGSWTSIDEMTPGGLGVLGNCFPARRKPKPVTRDVLAWDLEPGMRVALAETNVIEADRVVRLRDGVDVHTPSGSVLSVDRNQTFAVLVEEPNG